MRQLTLKDVVKFRLRSDKAKKSFAKNLLIEKPKTESEQGGDYWISSVSAIRNSYKKNTLKNIADKISELRNKQKDAGLKRTKDMYKRNIDILSNYRDFDFAKWRPSKELVFLPQDRVHSFVSIKKIPIRVSPQHIFEFKRGEIVELGAIWFVAQLNGFRNEEIEMFCDALHRYLKANFSHSPNISSKYCLAVDVFNNIDVNYSQLEKREYPSILNDTLDEIKKLQ